MSILIILMLGLGIILYVCLTQYMDDKARERDNRLAEIERIHSRVTEDFEDIIALADKFGNEYYDGLMDFANKMDKMLEIQNDLKSYDVFYHKRLYEKSKGARSRFIGRIIVDKNLVPKFMVTPQSAIPSQLDIELEVALTSDGVRELAEKCRKIKMDEDIEAFRKDKVEKVLNGK